MNIIDLYRSILNCGGLNTDDEGYVSVKFDTKQSPVLVNGKRLVLPTHKQLTSENWNDKIIFHPLSENILRGESEVITKMRSVFNIRLNYTFGVIAQNLLSIVSSVSDHKKLNPEQSEVLSAILEADETTLLSYTKIMLNLISESPEKAFINIFLKRGGSIGGKKHSRVGIVTFPLYEELKKTQETYCGVKLRAKDRQALIQLYQYILPMIDTEEAYNFGSDSSIAPFLDALMGTVLGIASKMNDVLELFGDFIDDGKELVFESDWVEAFENLAVMVPQIRQIPVQTGNEGKSKAGDEPQAVVPVSLQQVQQLAYHTPVVPPIAPNQFGFPQQPQQPQFQQPQQPQQPAGLVITENGIDFNSLLRVKPAIAGTAIGFGSQPMMNNQMMQQQAIPRWAQPNIQQPQFQQFQQPQFQQQYQQPVYPSPITQYPGSLV